MKIEIESKYEKGDLVYLEAFGINTFQKENILEVAATRDNKSFIYRIPSRPPSCKATFNWIPEEDLYSSLYELQNKWHEDLKTPKEY